MWLDLIFGATAVLFGAASSAALLHLRWARRLPAMAELDRQAPASVPSVSAIRCSVVLAARDEEARIEATVRKLLAQQGVGLEVIAVDDRSADRTAEILGRLAAEDPRLKVIRIDALPADWLGKCHACHVGAGAVTGEWILFTDADCWLRPDVIARALRVAGREGADHITLTPGIAPESVGTQAWHLMFLITLADWMSRVNRGRPGAYLGMGAFNLVRAAAYQQCGGYQALRLTVLDDVRLGLLLCRAGKRTRAFLGGADVECRWGATAWSMTRIMEKNYFAALDYRLGRALVASLGGIVLWSAGVAGAFSGSLSGMAAGAALFSLSIPAAVCARRLRWPFIGAALTPLVFPLLCYAILNSAIVTVRQGGVRWRNTFYSLDTLRKGGVR